MKFMIMVMKNKNAQLVPKNLYPNARIRYAKTREKKWTRNNMDNTNIITYNVPLTVFMESLLVSFSAKLLLPKMYIKTPNETPQKFTMKLFAQIAYFFIKKGT